MRKWFLIIVALGTLSTGCSREYVLAALQGLEEGASAPITTCRTIYASRKDNAAYTTTCNTIGGY